MFSFEIKNIQILRTLRLFFILQYDIFFLSKVECFIQSSKFRKEAKNQINCIIHFSILGRVFLNYRLFSPKVKYDSIAYDVCSCRSIIKCHKKIWLSLRKNSLVHNSYLGNIQLYSSLTNNSQ